MAPRINKWLDLLDRVGWTALEAASGAAITVLTGATLGWRAALTFVGTTTLVAVGKVVLAQRTGTNDLGALVPGEVITPPPVSK
jgi:hypothetical protein